MILQRFSSANVYRVLISSACATGFYWPIQSLAPDKWPCSSSPQNVYTSRADPGLLDNQHPPESPSRDTPGKSPGTPPGAPRAKARGPPGRPPAPVWDTRCLCTALRSQTSKNRKLVTLQSRISSTRGRCRQAATNQRWLGERRS